MPTAKSVGVQKDENLSWSSHIETSTKRFASDIDKLGNCNLTRSNKLEKLQNRATRILTFSTYDTNVEHLFSKLRWRKLSAQREMQKAVMVFKSLNGFTPECRGGLFVNLLFHCLHQFFLLACFAR